MKDAQCRPSRSLRSRSVSAPCPDGRRSRLNAENSLARPCLAILTGYDNSVARVAGAVSRGPRSRHRAPAPHDVTVTAMPYPSQNSRSRPRAPAPLPYPAASLRAAVPVTRSAPGDPGMPASPSLRLSRFAAVPSCGRGRVLACACSRVRVSVRARLYVCACACAERERGEREERERERERE